MFVRVFGSLSCAVILCSCYTGGSDSLRDPVAQDGISATVQANLPYGESRVDVVASFYKDGRKQPLVGGDVIIAGSDVDSVFLKSLQNLSGNYYSDLSISDSSAGVSFSIEYDPLEAQDDRWYPMDELLVDAGPGDLVGYTTAVAFPDPLMLTAPVGNEVYTDRSQDVVLTWNTSPTTEQLRLTTVQTCHSGERSIQWGTSRIITPAVAGTFSVNVGSLIPSTNFINVVSDFVDQLSVIVVGAILDAYSFGLIDEQDIKIESFDLDYCSITLTVFREISNDLGAGISGGYAIGSTSDTATVVYQP